jgi:hypothetical protein
VDMVVGWTGCSRQESPGLAHPMRRGGSADASALIVPYREAGTRTGQISGLRVLRQLTPDEADETLERYIDQAWAAITGEPAPPLVGDEVYKISGDRGLGI